MEDLSAFSARPRLAALLDHFAEIADTRQGWKVMYPLREVLFLVVCGTIASGDDYDDIVDWGKAHLAFLRGFAEFHFGIPCAPSARSHGRPHRDATMILLAFRHGLRASELCDLQWTQVDFEAAGRYPRQERNAGDAPLKPAGS